MKKFKENFAKIVDNKTCHIYNKDKKTWQFSRRLIMNREEVLAISRSENRNGDERDLKNKEKSYSIGASVATLVCIIMVTVEEGILNRSATDIWVIYTAIEFSIALSGAILSKKKWLIGFSIFIGIIFALMVFFYIKEILAVI